jgi:hypothetical protein
MVHAYKIVVFTKDRACQLESLLRSIGDHCTPQPETVTVVYKATTEEFAEGYRRVRDTAPPGCVFFEEHHFRADLISLVKQLDDDAFIMFLVDDNIVFRPVDLNPLFDAYASHHLFISLRADRNYKGYRPAFLKENQVLEWNWTFRKPRRTVWNYPFSLDGNIYRTRQLKGILPHVSFKAPNSFESGLHGKRRNWRFWGKNRALAPANAAVFNNPLNAVQTEGATWHGDCAIEVLNGKFLDGFRLDNQHLYGVQPTGVHFFVEPKFVCGG